jgi:branched-chain amino acid transport system ATP-binding protein
VLKERQNQVGKTLSGGEQQMLAIARALMPRPRVILMDEVSLGLMPIYVEETFKVIENLHRQGVTILLVEQNARKALAAADRGYVLETGEIVLSDSSQKLATNPQVKKAYLGGT